MTSAVSSIGSVYKVGDGASPESYSTVGDVLTLAAPDVAPDQIDVSSHDSGSFKEYIRGLIDGGQVSVDFNWTNSAAQQQLRDSVSLRVGHRVEFADGTIVQAQGIVKRLVFSLTPAEQIKAAAVIKITGAVTYTETDAIQFVFASGADDLQFVFAAGPDDVNFV